MRAIVPREPAKSELLRRLTSNDEDDRMPQDADPLPAEQIELLKTWIRAGAEWSEVTPQRAHWAYVSPKQKKAAAGVRCGGLCR